MRKGHGYIFNETEELRDAGDGKSCERIEVRPVQNLSFLMSPELFGLGCI